MSTFLEWRLKAEIARAGYATIAEFGHELQRHIAISRPHIYRLVESEPTLLNWDVLHGLCDTLRCAPADLIVLRRETPQRVGMRGSATRRIPPRLVLP